MDVNLSQFTSLFEIGFALHFAVAFIDRIYARELPVRVDRITARAKAIERLRKEIQEDGNKNNEIRFTHRTIENPIWQKHNDQVLDRLYALRLDVRGQMHALKRILKVITFLAIIVLLYSISMLFLIGLEHSTVQGLSPMTASIYVLMQLLPLPIAASIFFFVARRMSTEIDRKIRGVTELNLLLSDSDASAVKGYVSVEKVYQRDIRHYGFPEGGAS